MNFVLAHGCFTLASGDWESQTSLKQAYRHSGRGSLDWGCRNPPSSNKEEGELVEMVDEALITQDKVL